ncbi:MAG: dual specificity protein phosphatase family protein [Gemmatimonadaceae bacterium]|nr:dual specificity protein phosphatase family protein [Gemmatimonadaceae bacterium]
MASFSNRIAMRLASVSQPTERSITIRGDGSGHSIYVHCWGGVGRTGTVVGCYIVRHGRTGDDALGEVNDSSEPRSSRAASLRGHPRRVRSVISSGTLRFSEFDLDDMAGTFQRGCWA